MLENAKHILDVYGAPVQYYRVFDKSIMLYGYPMLNSHQLTCINLLGMLSALSE
jgi:hypothetical protein